MGVGSGLSYARLRVRVMGRLHIARDMEVEQRMSTKARARTQELRRVQMAAAARAARRRRLLRWVWGLVVVALVVAIAVTVVQAVGGDDDGGPPEVSGEVVTPANASDDGIHTVGTASAPVTVGIYYDYMCPACGAFEAANAEELDRLLDDGTVKVELRPLSFLDEMSEGTRYSTRAANAFATVVDGAPDQAWDFHNALYASQPAEGTEGLSDDEIGDIARDVGVPDDVVARFADDTYVNWVADITQQSFDSGVNSTPTVTIDGEVFTGDVFSVGPLTEAIEAAADTK